jgi:NADPH2:quinone reductase
MRAWRLETAGEPADVLHLEDTAAPEPGPGELVIQVEASGLGLPDVMQCRGTYSLLPPRPMTPGLEFCGRVTAAGEGAQTPVGAQVMGVAAFATGFGAFADRCKAFDRSVYPLAPGMTAAEAAGFTIAYHTAHVGLVRRARLQAGETVLVHGGAGGTGLAAIQLAKALGARVLATAGGPERVAACLAAGADLAFDHQAEDWVQETRAATEGRGAAVIYDPVGGEMFERSADCVAPEGRILPIGFASGRRGQLPMDIINLRNITVMGALAGGGWMSRAEMLAMHQDLLGRYVAGRIRANIDEAVPFADIPRALTRLAERRVRGRIVALH